MARYTIDERLGVETSVLDVARGGVPYGSAQSRKEPEAPGEGEDQTAAASVAMTRVDRIVVAVYATFAAATVAFVLALLAEYLVS